MMKTYSELNEKGFTLIELIFVLIIVLILAITIVPQFMDISSTAQINATNSIAGSLTSANADNYAVRTISITHGRAVTNCRSVANLLQSGLPSGYTINSRNVRVNVTVNCTLRGPSSTTATFLATGIR